MIRMFNRLKEAYASKVLSFRDSLLYYFIQRFGFTGSRRFSRFTILKKQPPL